MQSSQTVALLFLLMSPTEAYFKFQRGRVYQSEGAAAAQKNEALGELGADSKEGSSPVADDSPPEYHCADGGLTPSGLMTGAFPGTNLEGACRDFCTKNRPRCEGILVSKKHNQCYPFSSIGEGVWYSNDWEHCLAFDAPKNESEEQSTPEYSCEQGKAIPKSMYQIVAKWGTSPTGCEQTCNEMRHKLGCEGYLTRPDGKCDVFKRIRRREVVEEDSDHQLCIVVTEGADNTTETQGDQHASLANDVAEMHDDGPMDTKTALVEQQAPTDKAKA